MKIRAGLLLLWVLCALAAVISLVWLFCAALVASPRAWRIAIGFDQTANAAIGGDEDEPISSRCWRFRRVQPYQFLRAAIDAAAALAGDHDHCRTSCENEIKKTRQRLGAMT